VGIARHKVEKAHRSFLDTGKRDLARQVPLGERDGPAAAMADPTPTPLQAALESDAWEHYLQRLPPVFQRLVLLLRDGLSQQEIAARLGVTNRTVRRLLGQLAYVPAAG
jgi:DNA-directed RNA polymerase specialized sigma24 family protein